MTAHLHDNIALYKWLNQICRTAGLMYAPVKISNKVLINKTASIFHLMWCYTYVVHDYYVLCRLICWLILLIMAV